MVRILVLVFAAINLAALIGCKKISDVSFQGPQGVVDSDIFSNRPIAARPQIYTIHLSSPALLTVGEKTDHGWVIPESYKKQILAEQAEFVAKAQSLSPDIQILYRFRLVLNAVTLVASSDLAGQFQTIAGVTSVETNGSFGRPMLMAQSSGGGIPSPTSVQFIGADVAQKNGIDGRGIRIGIIDTGIDYTHAMLGGHGDPAEYAAIKPDQPTPLFPNDKVIGGIDLVGTKYDAASELPDNYIPHPDGNPLDEAGHGSHVAGTVAGIGDGVNTYTGVAPAAKLYAIKVFGKEGSTSDAVVIAGLEYAADPNGDLNPDDQLDVVNLSLGGDYGTPHILYAEAVKNLSNAGTAVVCAAGNSGPQDNIVGAPGTSAEALSVAASIDGAPVNWRFSASQLTFPDGKTLVVKDVEGSLTKPVAQSDGVQGKLVFIGLADKPLQDPLKSQLKGNVALILRGGVTFAVKLQTAADAGAIGAVVINNAPGEPIAMGGDGSVNIPGIMISQDDGQTVQSAMQNGDVQIIFKTSQIIEQPERIDTITSFSSKGPRSEDDLIKPEIAAPGSQILSAAMGKGTLGVRFDGTSMATPHMTGVIALMMQAHPDLSVAELKSLVMNNAKVLSDATKIVYPISVQGAGRVQVLNALAAKAIATPSLSLGLIQSSAPVTVHKLVQVTNLASEPQTFQVTYQNSAFLTIRGPSQIDVGPNSSTQFEVMFTISGLNPQALAEEIDGRVTLKSATDTIEIPALAMRTEISSIVAQAIQKATSVTNVTLSNVGLTEGEALPFNLLGLGKPKQASGPSNNWKSKSCALKSAGYRIVNVPNQNKAQVPMLQFAFELFDPLTTWNYCELNVQFDVDGDGTPDYELAGVAASNVAAGSSGYISLLLNATESRQIRATYEKKIRQGLPVPPPNYQPAMLDGQPMVAYPNSTIAVIQVDPTQLGIKPNATIGVKLALSNDDADNALEPDDFLTDGYQQLSLDVSKQSYTSLPFDIGLDAKQSSQVNFNRGTGGEPLVIYLPENVAGSTSIIVQ
jgi:subtilisin family serine protease